MALNTFQMLCFQTVAASLILWVLNCVFMHFLGCYFFFLVGRIFESHMNIAKKKATYPAQPLIKGQFHSQCTIWMKGFCHVENGNNRSWVQIYLYIFLYCCTILFMTHICKKTPSIKRDAAKQCPRRILQDCLLMKISHFLCHIPWDLLCVETHKPSLSILTKERAFWHEGLWFHQLI